MKKLKSIVSIQLCFIFLNCNAISASFESGLIYELTSKRKDLRDVTCNISINTSGDNNPVRRKKVIDFIGNSTIVATELDLAATKGHLGLSVEHNGAIYRYANSRLDSEYNIVQSDAKRLPEVFVTDSEASLGGLAAIILQTDFLDVVSDKNIKIEADGSFVLEINSEGKIIEYSGIYSSEKNSLLSLTIKFNESNHLIINQIEYSDFKKIKSKYFPGNVQINAHSKNLGNVNTDINIEYFDSVFNNNVAANIIKIPKGYTVNDERFDPTLVYVAWKNSFSESELVNMWDEQYVQNGGLITPIKNQPVKVNLTKRIIVFVLLFVVGFGIFKFFRNIKSA